MRFPNKKAFRTNLLLMIFGVFIPSFLLSVMFFLYWNNAAKKHEFESDTKFLSLVGQSFDTILSDTTQIISLLEFDSAFKTAVDSLESADSKLSPSHFLYLNNVWDNTSRTLMAKPYVRSAYLYLEQRPDLVFTNEGVRNIRTLTDTSWLDAYHRQNPNISLWAEQLCGPQCTQDLASQAIYLFRRFPVLNWDEAAQGVMVVRLESQYFDELLSNIPMIESKHIYILDDKNNQIYANTTIPAERYISPSDISIANNTNILKSTSEGEFLVSTINSQKFNWTYISAVPTKAVLSELNYMTRTSVIFCCITFCVSILLAVFITVRNYRPVKLMLRMINTYNTEGNIKPVKSLSRDEYGYIIYNLMQNLVEKTEIEKKLTQEKLLKNETRLQALQSQINPHFLYNTLEAINWEAIELLGPNNTISEMLVRVAYNLRYITHYSDTLVPIREDLTSLRNYIEIHKMIAGDRIAFSFRYREEVLNCLTLKLLIEPLVENAVVHGLMDMQQNGKVRISILHKGDQLVVRVIDNGCGIPPEKLYHIRNDLARSDFADSESIGLMNICHRLQLKFGSEYRLSIHSKSKRGTRVSFSIPYTTVPE